MIEGWVIYLLKLFKGLHWIQKTWGCSHFQGETESLKPGSVSSLVADSLRQLAEQKMRTAGHFILELLVKPAEVGLTPGECSVLFEANEPSVEKILDLGLLGGEMDKVRFNGPSGRVLGFPKKFLNMFGVKKRNSRCIAQQAFVFVWRWSLHNVFALWLRHFHQRNCQISWMNTWQIERNWQVWWSTWLFAILFSFWLHRRSTSIRRTWNAMWMHMVMRLVNSAKSCKNSHIHLRMLQFWSWFVNTALISHRILHPCHPTLQAYTLLFESFEAPLGWCLSTLKDQRGYIIYIYVIQYLYIRYFLIWFDKSI